MSLYPLMYLDKKRNKEFFFFVVRHRLFVYSVSLGVNAAAICLACLSSKTVG